MILGRINRCRSWRATSSAVLTLLYGVTPVALPEDPCAVAALRGSAPTQREWRLITSSPGQLRLRRVNSSEWISPAGPQWSPDGIRGRIGVEVWQTGRKVQSDTLLVFPWGEIQLIEQQRGRGFRSGMITGGAVGLMGGIAFAAFGSLGSDDSWGLDIVPALPIAISAGMLVGGIVGSLQLRWSTVYCSSSDVEVDQ